MSSTNLKETLDLAINAVVRPPRASYNEEDISYIVFDMHLPPIPRIPMSFPNRRGERIVGSLYICGSYYQEETHKCIVFLHGNVGSQKEGRSIVPFFAPNGVSVFCFDFSGSGNSDGEFVTLGMKEKTDVADVVKFLADNYDIGEFVVWGRSMGASCAILSSMYDQRIKGIIADSAFSSLEDMLNAVAKKFNLGTFSNWIAAMYIKKGIYKKIGLTCDDVNVAEFAKKCTKPILFGHSPEDDFIPFEQAEKIYKAYRGEKKIVILTGSHNSLRDENWIKACRKFISEIFGIKIEKLETKVTLESAAEHVKTFMNLLEESSI